MSTWIELKNNPRIAEIYRQRAVIIHLIRDFFWSRDFVETDTPVAVKLPGQEPYLNPVPVELHDPRSESHKFYLQTSPEFAMKKLLAAGWPKIFQICKCFRDYEDFGGRHNTEFTMIEWYRAPGNLSEIMDDTENLFKFVGARLGVNKIKYKEREINIDWVWERHSMKEIWQKLVGVNLDEYLELPAMGELVKKLGLAVSADDVFEDLFYKIFLNQIEPRLGWERPVFIYDYPASMSSLSRRSAIDSRYAERFELYIGGLELANAFGELVDAKEQAERLEEDREKRKMLGKETWPVDPDFIAALQSGVPEAGGIALGVDRMVLLFTEARDLNEVIFQSIKDQII